MNEAPHPCIVIADDNPNNLKVLCAMLESKGYDVRVAMDGAQALSIIKKVVPDLILLDVHMPEMDGYAVTDAVKQDPALKEIPIIFISALNEPFNKMMGFQKGAVDYIEKPFQVEEVEARVHTHLTLRAFQKKLAQKAAHSETRFRLTFENAAVGIAHIRKGGRFIRVNRCLCRITGYDEADFSDLTVRELVHPDDWQEDLTDIKDLFTNRIDTIRKENRFLKKDRSPIWARLTVSMARDGKDNTEYGIMVVEDVTDLHAAEEKRKRMESQLRQAQRMEAIGTLAGGIAHDFNNILGIIMGYTDLAKQRLGQANPVEKEFHAIETATHRAKDLVRHILTSCRQSEQEKRAVRIDPIVKEALKLLKASLPAFINIKTDIRECGPILADPTQVHQVVMNLCTNAYQAMEEAGGTLAVSLTGITLYNGRHMDNLSLIPGDYTLLEVTDTGSGITPRVLERIFEPYFTTKQPNKGTGLGLAVVHGIVKSHDGEIVVYSEEGKGTSFKVYLPCIKTAEQAAAREPDAPVEGGTESLLIVDDNKPYLDMMASILKELQYQVTAVQDSVEALERIRNAPREFHCMITDMTMPKMTGSQLTRKVLEIVPHLPVIMFTGFSEIINRENAEEMGIRAFIMKPAIRSEVAATLRRVLDEAYPDQ